MVRNQDTKSLSGTWSSKGWEPLISQQTVNALWCSLPATQCIYNFTTGQNTLCKKTSYLLRISTKQTTAHILSSTACKVDQIKKESREKHMINIEDPTLKIPLRTLRIPSPTINDQQHPIIYCHALQTDSDLLLRILGRIKNTILRPIDLTR